MLDEGDLSMTMNNNLALAFTNAEVPHQLFESKRITLAEVWRKWLAVSPKAEISPRASCSCLCLYRARKIQDQRSKKLDLSKES